MISQLLEMIARKKILILSILIKTSPLSCLNSTPGSRVTQIKALLHIPPLWPTPNLKRKDNPLLFVFLFIIMVTYINHSILPIDTPKRDQLVIKEVMISYSSTTILPTNSTPFGTLLYTRTTRASRDHSLTQPGQHSLISSIPSSMVLPLQRKNKKLLTLLNSEMNQLLLLNPFMMDLLKEKTKLYHKNTSINTTQSPERELL